jgi:hypothetical protein
VIYGYEVLELIRRPPDDVTTADIMEELYFKQIVGVSMAPSRGTRGPSREISTIGSPSQDRDAGSNPAGATKFSVAECV